MRNRTNWITIKREKCHNIKNVQFEKSVQKIKNTAISLMTTFYNFAFKFEIS